MEQPYANYLKQTVHAEEWFNRVTVLAAKYGVTMIHDEIIFDSAEQAEAFNRELAGLAI